MHVIGYAGCLHGGTWFSDVDKECFARACNGTSQIFSLNIPGRERESLHLV